MKEFKIQLRSTELQPGDQPTIDQVGTFITEPTRFTLAGETVGIYLSIRDKPWLDQLRAIAQTTPQLKTNRVSGVPTQSAAYGYLPRVHVRTAYCRLSKFSQDEPRIYHGVKLCSKFMNDLYRDLLPEAYEYNRAKVDESINQDYHIEDTVFTTCNFNFNHAIKYHRDSGNVKDVYSNVIILKKGLVGGHLIFPEWGITLAQDDGYLAIFDGQRFLHGVTPVKKVHEKGYRCSVVFYALESMRNCLAEHDELEHAKDQRAKIESKFRNIKP